MGIETGDFKLVGFSNFVRTNPRSDHFPFRRFHHVEFWAADATTTAGRFSAALSMPLAAKSDLSTGNSAHASYLLRSAHLDFIFTATYSPSLSDPTSAAMPSFSPAAHGAFISAHSFGVRAIAVLVDSAATAFSSAVSRGAIPTFHPTPLSNTTTIAEVHLFGDTVLRFVSSDVAGEPFLPGFEPVDNPSSTDCTLRRLDHAVGCVDNVASAAEYIKAFTGFHEFDEFTAEDVGTSESGLNSIFLANNEENIIISVTEPALGMKRKSQIQTFLDHNEGPGIQHLALESEDIFRTLREMKKMSNLGGFEFMPSPGLDYYNNIMNKVGDVLSDEQIGECQKLGILVDRDDQGILLQIFTKPVGDRPTLFLEIIQRIGCMLEDEQGNFYQKGGCGGFGKGNVSELFKSVEDYEKMLESKRHNKDRNKSFTA